MMNLKSLFGLLFSTFVVLFYAQETVTISGKIVDEEKLTGVPYSSVSFVNKKDSTLIYGNLTNENGDFSFEVKKGMYSVLIQSIDFDDLKITIHANETKNIGNIKQKITKKSDQLTEVVVKVDKPIYKFELDKRVYDVTQDLNAKGGSLADILQNVPSVQIDAEGAVSLRGSSNVRFLIDGKPSSMLGISNSADALKQFSADQIERIEVVTNPSSRYDAEGTSGILNIILKKNKKKGFNGSIESTVGHLPNYGLNSSLNWKKETYGWFINTGYNYNESSGKSEISTQRFGNAIDSVSYQTGKRLRINKNFYLNTGFNADLNTKSNLFTTLSYRKSNQENINNIIYTDFDRYHELFEESYRKETGTGDDYTIQGNINYDYNFNEKGKKLTASFNSQYSKKNELSHINEHITFPTNAINAQDQSFSNEKQTRYITKVDYINPYKEGANIELGVQHSYTQNNNNFSVQSYNGTLWESNPLFTDDTEYKEQIAAAYVQYGNKINKFSYQIGLRAENSSIDVFSTAENENVQKNYLDFFSSLFLNYNFTEKNQLQLNFSRRINRPNGRFLIPFMTFSDDRNTFRGNPNLDPSYTISSELAYNVKIGMLNLTPTLFHRYTQDAWEIFVQQETMLIDTGNGIEERIIFVASPQNMDKNFNYGLELGYMYNPYKWWKMFGELNFFGYSQQGTYNGVSQDGEGTSFSGRLSMAFKFLKGLDMQIQSNVNGPQKANQNYRPTTYGVNFALSKDIFKNATLTFNVNDVFNSRRRLVETTGTNFFRDMDMQFRQRQINLTFTYRFNQEKKESQHKQREEGGEQQEMTY